jgi:hypothetical protein
MSRILPLPKYRVIVQAQHHPPSWIRVCDSSAPTSPNGRSARKQKWIEQ